MPHDINGDLVEIGDKITITFEVTNVNQALTACNVTLQAIDLNNTGEYKPQVSCNARLVQKIMGS